MSSAEKQKSVVRRSAERFDRELEMILEHRDYATCLGMAARMGTLRSFSTSAGVRIDGSATSARYPATTPPSNASQNPTKITDVTLWAGRVGTVAGTAMVTLAIRWASRASEVLSCSRLVR